MSNVIRKPFLRIFLGWLFSCCVAFATAEPIKISFWHSMAGSLGQLVNQIVADFNHSQSEYEIIPIYKGNYPETLMMTVAAFRAGQQPAMVQIFEVGTKMMSNPPGVIVPMHQLMKQSGISLTAKQFLPAIAGYYADKQGRLLAMPFNSSTPVMFYNRQTLAKAGLHLSNKPITWPELANIGEQLIAKGHRCGFTTSWPSWIQLEAMSAWQNIAFASANNGFDSVNPKLLFNNSTIQKHINHLAKWQKTKIFIYGGRADNAMALFTSGECPILMESSGSIPSIKANTDFPIGIAPIPYWPSKGKPQNMLIGGAAIWALAGQKPAVYRGIAQFYQYWSQTNIQLLWQKQSGYLPLTKAAYHAAQIQGFYQKNPGAGVALRSLLNKQPTPYSRGIRLGGYPQIRQLNNQALEAIFSGQQSTQQALENAVNKGNQILKQFAENIGT